MGEGFSGLGDLHLGEDGSGGIGGGVVGVVLGAERAQLEDEGGDEEAVHEAEEE